MHVAVCTFATPAYEGSAALLRYTAMTNGGADSFRMFTPESPELHDWRDKFGDVAHASRGYGWWSWKPACILATMDAARMRHKDSEDVIVVWCDAAVMLSSGCATAWARACDTVLLFRLGGADVPGSDQYANWRWTKPSTLAKLGQKGRDTLQVNAGIQVYRDVPFTRHFLGMYRDLCMDVSLIDDSVYDTGMPSGFRDHRHDQSLLTILSSIFDDDIKLGRDPTQYGVREPQLLDEEPTPPGVADHHRKRRNPVGVAVCTATRGTDIESLKQCMASVQTQTLPNVRHHILCDGRDAALRVRRALGDIDLESEFGAVPVTIHAMPIRTGANGYLGHRLYGASAWLVGDSPSYIAWLDDDNSFCENHLLELVRSVISHKARWGFALRRIDESLVDACESLGDLRYTCLDTRDRLVDTSCYIVSIDLAIEVSHAWNKRFRVGSGPEADRRLYHTLYKLGGQPACSRTHSVRYATSNTPQSVSRRFFEDGNARTRYVTTKPDLYVFHFDKDATSAMLEAQTSHTSIALREWQPSLFSGLTRDFNVLDGYACAGYWDDTVDDNILQKRWDAGHTIPRGSTVVVVTCRENSIPWYFLRSRPDCRRIVYTLESPNIRHAGRQWDPRVLDAHFDIVLTYWKPMLDMLKKKAVWCAHNTHHMDLDRHVDRHVALRHNRDMTHAKFVIVLEWRPSLRGSYVVPGVDTPRLTCLDPLRFEYVKALCALGKDVTAFGVGWDVARIEGLKIGHTVHRSRDPRTAVEIVGDFTFVIVVENCDAEGYVSEKLYDALMAGCIPLWHGHAHSIPSIPEGSADGVYLNMAKFESVDAAVRYVASLDTQVIEAWKARVVDTRERVLRGVDVHSFADVVRRSTSVGLVFGD